jgi:hypothetical protein
MRTLLIETIPSCGGQVDGLLTAAGHEVARCHHTDGPTFPCVGLTAEGCPLEDARGIDVAVAVRPTPDRDPAASESGLTCALRQGIPVVVVGDTHHSPYAGWTEHCGADDDVLDAVDRAIVAAGERRAAPLRAEVERLLRLEGLDPGGVTVTVARDGSTARVRVSADAELDERVAGLIATRMHAVDRTGAWPTTTLDVAVG